MTKLAGGILLAALSMVALADRVSEPSRVDATEPAVRIDAQGGPGRAKAAARKGRGPGLGYPDPQELVNPAPRPVREYGRGEGVGADSGPIPFHRQQRQHGDRLRNRVPQNKQVEPSPAVSTAGRQ